MINKFFNNSYLVLLIVFCLILLSIPFQIKIDSERDKFKSIKNVVLLNPGTLRIMSLGFNETVADIYWLRGLQYFWGQEFLSDRDEELTRKYFDIITELDPKFLNAYRYGASFLGEPHPLGLGNIELGSELYDKGRKNIPDNYRLPLEQGFMFFLNTNNFEKASELFSEAAQKPGLSDRRTASIKGMAAAAISKAGKRELSKQIWQEIYDTTQNEGRKNFALLNLKELNTQDLEDKLTNYANQYEQVYGSFPESIDDLLDLKEVKKIPKDHEGQDFFIDHETKSVKSPTLNKHLLSSKSTNSK